MTDRFVVRAVVLFLGVATLIGLAGLIWLVDQGHTNDAAMLAVIAGPTGAALGGLTALLVHTSSEPPAAPIDLAAVAQEVAAHLAVSAPQKPATAPQPAAAADTPTTVLPAGPVNVIQPA